MSTWTHTSVIVLKCVCPLVLLFIFHFVHSTLAYFLQFLSWWLRFSRIDTQSRLWAPQKSPLQSAVTQAGANRGDKAEVDGPMDSTWDRPGVIDPHIPPKKCKSITSVQDGLWGERVVLEWVEHSTLPSSVSPWHNSEMTKCTPGGKDKLSFMLEWVITEILSEKGDETDYDFFSFDHFLLSVSLIIGLISFLAAMWMVWIAENCSRCLLLRSALVTGLVSTGSMHQFPEIPILIGFCQL